MVSSMTALSALDWDRLREQADLEAAQHPLNRECVGRVGAAIVAARTRLGGDDVGRHPVAFNPRSWVRVLDSLPAQCVETGVITRADVFQVAAEDGIERARWRLFVASYVWGQGKNGYGLSRLSRIERATPAATLDSLIAEALDIGREHGAMAGYRRLRREYRQPVAAEHWGAAFFTKTLYFGLRGQSDTEPALILDKVMATQVVELSRLPHMLHRGGGYNWSYYRYGVYAAWMVQTAEEFHVSPELLEYSLFTMNRGRGTTAG